MGPVVPFAIVLELWSMCNGMRQLSLIVATPGFHYVEKRRRE
jgi:hypothetical protein